MSSETVKQLLGLDLLESPQFYPGPVVYQKDAKFQPISANNFASYTVLGVAGRFTYALSPGGTCGFVFFNHDVANPPPLGMIPVLTVDLRDSPVGYKQAHHLRVREAYSRVGAATGWYVAYAVYFGGIASDFEHLEGGKALWKSLVRTAEGRGLKASIVNSVTKQKFPITAATPDSTIWSLDAEHRPILLVLEK